MNDGGEGQEHDDSKEEDAGDDEHLEVHNSDSVFTKVGGTPVFIPIYFHTKLHHSVVA